MKRLIRSLAGLWDILLAPFILMSLLLLKFVRIMTLPKMPIARKLFERIGIFPILDHWAEPFYNRQDIDLNKLSKRLLPGIDLNETEQLQLLKQFSYNSELKKLPLEDNADFYGKRYFFNNGNYESGDAEIYYNMIRHFKPATIIEIGCGHSTLLAQEALTQNEKENKTCRHIAIEPYQNAWVGNLPIEWITDKVEDVDPLLFSTLKANDILFIDSSHIIRPQGDVLFEFLELLPQLPSGVLIHIHDIFTPADYLKAWMVDDLRFYNEQYLMEAFLSNNKDFSIICAVNYLSHQYKQQLTAACPVYAEQSNQREPGSFWIKRR